MNKYNHTSGIHPPNSVDFFSFRGKKSADEYKKAMEEIQKTNKKLSDIFKNQYMTELNQKTKEAVNMDNHKEMGDLPKAKELSNFEKADQTYLRDAFGICAMPFGTYAKRVVYNEKTEKGDVIYIDLDIHDGESPTLRYNKMLDQLEYEAKSYTIENKQYDWNIPDVDNYKYIPFGHMPKEVEPNNEVAPLISYKKIDGYKCLNGYNSYIKKIEKVWVSKTVTSDEDFKELYHQHIKNQYENKEVAPDVIDELKEEEEFLFQKEVDALYAKDHLKHLGRPEIEKQLRDVYAKNPKKKEPIPIPKRRGAMLNLDMDEKPSLRGSKNFNYDDSLMILKDHNGHTYLDFKHNGDMYLQGELIHVDGVIIEGLRKLLKNQRLIP